MDKEHLVCIILAAILDRFKEMYFHLKSLYSSQDWERTKVMPACVRFIDGVRNCKPFFEAFKNKPKAMAVLELALQRQTSGSAQIFNQVMSETGHRQKRVTKFRSNNKYPELWVMSDMHTQYLLRFLLEGGTFGVFEIHVDATTGRPDMAAGFAPFQCSGVLTMLLTSTFLDKGFVPESIAGAPNAGREARNAYNANQGEKQWVSERTVPNLLRNNVLVRKMNRSTLTLTFAPEKHNVAGVFAPESHPARNVDNRIILDNSRDLRVVEFGEAQLLIGRPSMLQTLKKGTVVLADTAASRFGAIAWMIATVYVFQHAVRNESYVLLKVHPMSLMNGPELVQAADLHRGSTRRARVRSAGPNAGAFSVPCLSRLLQPLRGVSRKNSSRRRLSTALGAQPHLHAKLDVQ